MYKCADGESPALVNGTIHWELRRPSHLMQACERLSGMQMLKQMLTLPLRTSNIRLSRAETRNLTKWHEPGRTRLLLSGFSPFLQFIFRHESYGSL